MMIEQTENVKKNIDDIIIALDKETRILKASGIRVVITSAFNIFAALVVMCIYIYRASNLLKISSIEIILFVFLIILLIQALFYIYWFDQKRKHGDVIFEEASDYYEWLIKKQLSNNELNQINSKVFKLRVSFREYTRSCDLPLFPGKKGISTYTFINIMCVFIVGFSIIAMSINNHL